MFPPEGAINAMYDLRLASDECPVEVNTADIPALRAEGWRLLEEENETIIIVDDSEVDNGD